MTYIYCQSCDNEVAREGDFCERCQIEGDREAANIGVFDQYGFDAELGAMTGPDLEA